MAGKFTIVQSMEQGVPVFSISGYFTETSGIQLRKLVREKIQAGHKRFVFDFSGCPVINSLGIAAAMDITFDIIDELTGKVVYSRLNSIVHNAMMIAGIIPIVDVCTSIAEAVESALED